MKDTILEELVAPLDRNSSDYIEANRDMNRIKGFAPNLDTEASHIVMEIFDRFQKAAGADDEEMALKEIIKMMGYLEGYALTLE